MMPAIAQEQLQMIGVMGLLRAACAELRSVIVQVARTTGLLLDPIYSLAAWEVAVQQAEAVAAAESSPAARVCMLHCGGMHGLHGLAQRFPADF